MSFRWSALMAMVGLFTFAATGGAATLPRTPPPGAPPLVKVPGFKIVGEATQSLLCGGADICLRLTVVNQSSKPLILWHSFAEAQYELTIYDSLGKECGKVYQNCWGLGHDIERIFLPGEMLTEQYQVRSITPIGDRIGPPSPGLYTIVARRLALRLDRKSIAVA